MKSLLSDLDTRISFLYSPQGGAPALREAWRDRLLADEANVEISLPMVTFALTHGVSLIADLFVDEGVEVIVPNPCWGNYKGIFELRRGGVLRTWDFFTDDGRLNIEGLKATLNATTGRCVVILNFPGNPTGYSPLSSEVEPLLQVLLEHDRPTVVVCDDAYQGLVFESDVSVRSLFFELTRRCDKSLMLPVKVDGATKELAFFGGRVGFLTFGLNQEVAAPLVEKARAIARATVSSPPGPSQAVVLAALQSPAIEDEVAGIRHLLARRYRALKAAMPLVEHSGFKSYPFNAGCFALLKAPSSIDVDALRVYLIEVYSIGLVSLPTVGALRIAYCSMDERDIEPMLTRLSGALTAYVAQGTLEVEERQCLNK
jgi:aspartate/methionine/tyrosine aminotransferase